jgi:gluconokinase
MKNMDLDKSSNPVFVVMGVSGTGKTTLATALAEKHHCKFLEGDDFHPQENIDIMSSGRSLTDENRMPWLKELSLAAASHRRNEAVVVTCSSLKAIYRDEIRRQVPDVAFIHLEGSFDYVAQLMSQREGHFMPVSLLQSQFDALVSLQSEEKGIVISIENGIDAVLREAEAFLADNRNAACGS